MKQHCSVCMFVCVKESCWCHVQPRLSVACKQCCNVSLWRVCFVSFPNKTETNTLASCMSIPEQKMCPCLWTLWAGSYVTILLPQQQNNVSKISLSHKCPLLPFILIHHLSFVLSDSQTIYIYISVVSSGILKYGVLTVLFLIKCKFMSQSHFLKHSHQCSVY